jgi:ribosomal protein L16 Arg81 hydroxylase
MKTLPVDEVSSITKQEFERNYLASQKPLIIKGLANSQPAGRKWTIDYIRQVCGDVTVDVYDNNNKNSASAYTKADLKMPFSEFLDVMLKDEPTTLRMFLFNMFSKKPALREDFRCPQFIRGMMGRIGFMFFGAKGIKVRIHQDMDMSNVLLTQFHGRKRVVLVSPKYSRLLYKLPFNTHSLVDLDNPDYSKYPGLRYVEAYDCTLDAGDALFMPSGYWHYITYLDGGFAVSYRKMAHNAKWKMRGIVSLVVYMPFDKVMNKVVGPSWLAWKERLAHRRAAKEIDKMNKDPEKVEAVTQAA